MSRLSITEDDLHAYVDKVLPLARQAEVVAYLHEYPQEAVRISAYQKQIQDLRTLFNPVLDEPLPVKLLKFSSHQNDHQGGISVQPLLARWSLKRLAASLLIGLISAGGGWFAHDKFQPGGYITVVSSFPRQAAVAHAVFSADVKRPVEVKAEQEEQLVTWLSKRLGKPVHPPRLTTLGYELIGGRLLPGNSSAVAQFMYQNSSGQRLTLYVSTEIANNHDTAFRFAQEGSVNVFYWVDGEFGYALSASIDKAQLGEVSKLVYEQIEHK
jgi:anti-sigma factor RsiW